MTGFQPVAGVDANTVLHPVLVDANGKVLVVASGVTLSNVPIRVDTGGNVYTIDQGVTSGLVVKPVLVSSDGEVTVTTKGGDHPFSIKDVYGETVVNLSLAAGTNNLYGTTVPAGQIWYVSHVVAQYVGTITNVTLRITIYVDNVPVTLKEFTPIVSGSYYDVEVSLYMKTGDRVRLVVLSATLNDDASLWVAGYKMTAP